MDVPDTSSFSQSSVWLLETRRRTILCLKSSPNFSNSVFQKACDYLHLKKANFPNLILFSNKKNNLHIILGENYLVCWDSWAYWKDFWKFRLFHPHKQLHEVRRSTEIIICPSQSSFKMQAVLALNEVLLATILPVWLVTISTREF